MKRSAHHFPTPVRGIWIAILASQIYSTLYAITKLLKNYDPFQLSAISTVFSLVTLVLLSTFLGKNDFFKVKFALKKTNYRVYFANVLLGIVGGVSGYYALQLIGVAEFRTITLTQALFTYLPAAFFLKEAFNPNKFLIVGLGFLGVILIFKPDLFSLWNLGCLLALLMVFSYTMTVILASYKTRSDKVGNVIFTTACLRLPIVSLIAAFTWQPIYMEDLLLLFLFCFTGFTAVYLWVLACKLAPASTIEPYSYLGLPIATLYGYFLFENVPSISSWVGMLVICLAAALLYRTSSDRA